MAQLPRPGFSLIELLVTLAVLTILISTAMPALAEFIDRQRASAYLRQVSQHLAYARVAAPSTQTATTTTGRDSRNEDRNRISGSGRQGAGRT